MTSPKPSVFPLSLKRGKIWSIGTVLNPGEWSHRYLTVGIFFFKQSLHTQCLMASPHHSKSYDAPAPTQETHEETEAQRN